MSWCVLNLKIKILNLNRICRPGVSAPADPPGLFHIDKPIITPWTTRRAIYLHQYFIPLFIPISSEWLPGSHTHSLDADWLVAESGLTASLPRK